MKINIYFIMDGHDSTFHTMYDVDKVPPLEEGDEIYLTIKELSPRDLNEMIYSKDIIDKIKNDNTELIENFNSKDIVIDKINKYMTFNVVDDEKTKIDIEYICKYV